MCPVNIFQKLDQDIAEQLQDLQIQQKELLEKKKNNKNDNFYVF